MTKMDREGSENFADVIWGMVIWRENTQKGVTKLLLGRFPKSGHIIYTIRNEILYWLQKRITLSADKLLRNLFSFFSIEVSFS